MDPMPGSTMISIPQPPPPTDLSHFKLSSPPISSKSPDRDTSLSPASSPPSLAPSGVSMVSMASMLSRPPNFGLPGLPGIPFPGGFSPKEFSRLQGGGGGDYSNLMMHNRSYTRSPPPMVSPNDPTANDCKVVEYRGEKIAAFMINGKTMLCLPQAFELFLKNLVGGLHTVYTKCKRLEVMPMICNVEQVRVLRGLGAIQPGVNRCKLIADSDFDLLYKDCTTSRNQCYTSPAYKIQKINGLSSETSYESISAMRPPKRVLPFPSPSPQDAMLQLNRSPLVSHDQYSREAPAHHIEGGGSRFPVGHPMSHLMSLNNPLLSRPGMLPGLPAGLPGLPGLPGLHGGNAQALLDSYKQSYGDMIKHLHGLQKSQDIEGDEDIVKESEKSHKNGSVLNLAQAENRDQEDSIRGSDSDIGEPDIDGSDEEMDYSEAAKNGNEKEGLKNEEGSGQANMFQMMNQIQSIIKMTVEKAKQEEKNNSHQKCDLKDELDKEKESQTSIKRKIEKETKTTDLYLKRFKKERRLRKQLEDQLETETKKIQALEGALRSLSYDTLLKVKESIAKEAASREKARPGTPDGGDSQNGDVSDSGSHPADPAPSLAQLNYNISQMTSGDLSRSSSLFNSSIASSIPPNVSNSY